MEVYHLSDETSSTSESTYLQIHILGCPSSNPQDAAPHAPLFSQSGICDTGLYDHMSLLWQPVSLEILEGRPLCPLLDHLLST